jgi:hypothetical protein
VTFDTTGDVISTGSFQGDVGFGASAGSDDVFVAKYSPANAKIWGTRLGGAASDKGLAVAVDPTDQSVLVAGFATGSVDFGPGVNCGLTSGGSGSSFNIFVVKLEPTMGNCVWAKRFGDGSGQIATGVGTDASGNVYLTGYFAGSINFGGATTPITSAGSDDVFLAKLTPAGVALWAKPFGDTAAQYATAIAVDSGGTSAITGSFAGTVSFDGVKTFTSKGGLDVFVARFDKDGVSNFSDAWGDPDTQTGSSIAFDPSGAMVFTGQMKGSVSFGGSTLTASSPNVFLVKLASTGAYAWSSRFGDATNQQNPTAVTVDGLGNVSIAGYYQGSIDFGGANGSHTSRGSDDAFVAKFDPMGGPIWSKSYGDPGSQGAMALVAGATGLAVGGDFAGTVDFGGPVNLTVSPSVTSQGGEDAFVLKLAP